MCAHGEGSPAFCKTLPIGAVHVQMHGCAGARDAAFLAYCAARWFVLRTSSVRREAGHSFFSRARQSNKVEPRESTACIFERESQ